MSVAELSIRRPVTTIMCFVSLFAIGLIAALRLPLESLPDISAPFLFVQLPYPGSTPEEVERDVLRPVEESLATLSGIKRIRSAASAESASLFLEFDDWDRDIAVAAAEARDRIDAVRGDLPADLQRYFIQKWSTADEPILRVRLAGRIDPAEAYDLIDREFKRRLERLPGVARVGISGAPPREVEIAIAPDRLLAHGLTLDGLAERLRAVNFSVSAGQIDAGGQRLRVQPVGEIGDLQELRDLVIGGGGLRLADVAEVRLRSARAAYGRRLDGQPAVGLDVFRERDANLVQVSRTVLGELERIRDQASLDGLSFNVIEDQGENVTSSLGELAEAGAVGLLLSVAVLYFFLRHWPSTLMVTLAIPICFVMTLGFMHFVGATLNVLTMMGLLLAVGMLVDNAVVVVESIYQERERLPGRPREASIAGTRNVAIALSAGTLCHCIVFVPNLFGETNNISIFMSQIAITISVSLLASWLVAVSLIPMLSARMRTPPHARSERGAIARLQHGYARVLRWSLRHRGWSVAGIALVSALSVVPMVLTEQDMFGGEGGLETQVFYQWKSSYTLEQMSEEVLRVERFLEANRDRFHIAQVYSWFGEQDGSGTRISFDPAKVEDPAPLIEEIRRELPRSARARIGMGWPGEGGGDVLQVQLFGESTAILERLAKQALPALAARPELRDVRIDLDEGSDELAVRIDRERAAAFGFDARQVAEFVGLALRGAPLREFRRGDGEVPVWVRFAGADDFGRADLAGFMVRSADGRTVPLLSLVSLEPRTAASQIRRVDRQTVVSLRAGFAPDVTRPQARAAIEAELSQLALPEGYRYGFDGGDFQDDDEAGRQMMFNLAIAVIMIYVVMAAVFESLLFPAAIMSGVVFSVFGVFWLFWLTGTAFGIMAFIGILVLMGVVVNNGIVMVEHINQLRRRGMARTEALVAGSRERLRPIMMTMGTAILAMVPISLTDTQLLGNGPPYYPMARAIAGGLAFSTVVSLLFLPTIYAILDDLGHGAARLLARARAPSSGAARLPLAREEG